MAPGMEHMHSWIVTKIPNVPQEPGTGLLLAAARCSLGRQGTGKVVEETQASRKVTFKHIAGAHGSAGPAVRAWTCSSMGSTERRREVQMEREGSFASLHQISTPVS